MGQYHNTVREELEEILERLQDCYRKEECYRKTPAGDRPSGFLLLFSGSEGSYSIQDVARATSELAPLQGGTASCNYEAYLHNKSVNTFQVGNLRISAAMGTIEVSYTKIEHSKKVITFKMNVGMNSRVIDYDLKGRNRTWRSMFTKDMLISELELKFQGKA